MRRHWLRVLHRSAGCIASVALILLAATSSLAQTPSTDSDSPARFIPNENLAMYVEFDGLDAHAEGWRKTAAYRILNETPTGAMLEDLFAQLYARFPLTNLTGPEALQVVKHCAKAGFVIGANVWKPEGSPQKGFTLFVIRNGFSNKEVRPLLARLLQNLPAPGTKAQPITKSGHRLITGKRIGGENYLWWVEETKKEDLLLAFGAEGMDDPILDTIDGKKPSALTNAYRTEVAKPREAMERTGFLLLDSTVFAQLDPNVGLPKTFDQLNLSRVDFSGGFQGDALTTVSRFHPKNSEVSKSKSIAALFDKSTIPTIPSGVLAFSVLALDMKAIPAQVHKIKELSAQYDQLVTLFKEKMKVRFEEDLLGQLGPKITAYIAPSKTTTPASVLPNALSVLTRLGGSGADAIPRIAVLIDVANPTAFNRTLDEIMGYVNRQIKIKYATPPGLANEAPPLPDRGGRGRGPGAPPAPEFRIMAGETKSYVFSVPPELSSTIPAGFRPTIRVGPKQVAIAVSADVARQALEAKGTYVAPSEIAAAFGQLPGKMNWLMILDPRDSTPEILASLPAKLQAGINTAMPASTPTAGAPGGGSAPPTPGGERKTLGGPGLAPPIAAGGRPSAPAGGGPGVAAAGSAPGPLVLQVDSSKLPSVEETRNLLFPAIYTIDEEGDAIRFTTRVAFPPLPDPSILGLIVRTVRIRQNPGGVIPGSSALGGPSAPTTPGATAAGSRPDERSPGMPRSRPGVGRNSIAPDR